MENIKEYRPQREYARKGVGKYTNKEYVKTIKFIKNTYFLFGVSMLISFSGSFIYKEYSYLIDSLYIYFLSLQIIITSLMIVAKNYKIFNILFLTFFSFFNGILVFNIINFIFKDFNNMFLIMSVFLMLGFIFSIVSIFKLKKRMDMNNYKILYFIMFLSMSISLYLNVYIYDKSLFSVLFSYLCVVLITIMVISDTETIDNNNFKSDIEGVIQLYINFLNLFRNIWNSLTKFEKIKN